MVRVMIETVAIVGTGLIGSSFGLALKAAGFEGRIVGVSSALAIKDALERGAIDESLPLVQAVASADLVFLSQTISRILETLRVIGPCLRPETLVTDAGSTKMRIVEQAGRLIRGAQFLGGHPMAGKEKRGAGEADGDLFAGRTWILTPVSPADLETPAARELVFWIRKTGAVPLAMAPEEHDRVVALTSHLPQLLSTALAATLAARLTAPDHLKAGGPGLADMTRLASSSYDLWRDILETNRAAVDSALAGAIEELQRIRTGLTSDEVRRAFETAAAFAAKLRK
jgi:prephenate dehydrogenase